MRVRALDSHHDWLFGKGANDYKKNRDAVAQNIETRLLSFFNDCFFAATAGIDWFNYLQGKNLVELNLVVSSTILNTENVTQLDQLSIVLNRHSRVITIRYTATTVYGQVTASQSVNLNRYLITQSGVVIATEDGDRIIV